MNLYTMRVINFLFFDFTNKIFFIALTFVFAILAIVVFPVAKTETSKIMVGDINLETIPHPEKCKLSIESNNDKWYVICTMTK